MDIGGGGDEMHEQRGKNKMHKQKVWLMYIHSHRSSDTCGAILKTNILKKIWVEIFNPAVLTDKVKYQHKYFYIWVKYHKKFVHTNSIISIEYKYFHKIQSIKQEIRYQHQHFNILDHSIHISIQEQKQCLSLKCIASKDFEKF